MMATFAALTGVGNGGNGGNGTLTAGNGGSPVDIGFSLVVGTLPPEKCFFKMGIACLMLYKRYASAFASE